MNPVWILRAAFLVLVSTSVPIEAQEECPRIRKDWDVLTPTEKDTYKRALAAAMDSGAYIKFVEIHTEMRSEMEAHRNCMFLIWHRCFLLAFENMLRGQGQEFACVTVPIFNFVGMHDRLLAGMCSSIGDCSAILKELGGYGNGVRRTVNINGRRITAACESGPPLNRFCQSGNVSDEDCIHCIPRTNWGSTPVPATTSYASVRQQIFGARDISHLSRRIEQGCHNNIHHSLQGVLGSLAAPSDPMFWPLHATVDLFHLIFYKCRFGTRPLTFAQRASHPLVSAQCTLRDGNAINSADVVSMRTGGNHTNNKIDARLDPLIGPYFANIPTRFAEFMDARDLGYSYEIRGQLAEMFLSCDSISTPEHQTTGNGRKLEAENGLLSNIRRESPCEHVSNRNSSLLSSNVLGATTATVASTTSSLQNDLGTNIMDVITVATKSLEEELVSNWYDKTMSDMGGQCPEAMADLESQVCMYEDQCLGGTPEYSAEFQAEWGVMESRCTTIVKAIKSGQQKIMHANWRQDMESFFGCPQPANATQTASQAGDYGSVVDISILPNAVPSV